VTLLLPADYVSIRTRVAQALASLDKDASASDRGAAVAFVILQTEQANNSRFLVIDGDPFLFTGFNKRLLALQHGDLRWATHLLMVYGVNVKDREISPKITQALASYAITNGRAVSPRRWSAFVDGALYLSRYDGTTYKLTGAGVDESDDETQSLVDDIWLNRRSTWAGRRNASRPPLRFDIEDNGTNVLFADDDGGSVPTAPAFGRNGKLFQLLRGIAWSRESTSMRPKHQVQALMIWMLATAFPDLFPTKPIVIAEGAPGSGKSTTLQMIQQALFGSVEPFTVSEDGLRDFWLNLMTSPITLLDNTDDIVKWLPDQIAAYTTRGFRKERKLHTNTGTVVIRPNAFICVASQDPKNFRRGDVADRSIVLRMESRVGRGGENIAAIAARIERERAVIWGEWAYFLNRVVAALAREPVRRTTARLGDFEVFAYAACRALGWQSSIIVPELMAALSRERATFAAEADIVLDVLEDWLVYPSNVAREISLRDLFRDLSSLAGQNNKPFVRTPQALAHRLRAPHVRLMYDVAEWNNGDQRMYRVIKAPTTVIVGEN
jgi:hypothetical protein